MEYSLSRSLSFFLFVRKEKSKNTFEIEQDPLVLDPHVLSLPFVCRKTLAKE